MSKLCKNLAMLFYVDMIYLAKQAKLDVEKSFALRCGPKPNRTQNGISSVLCQIYESMQMFCQFKLRTRAFYTWHVHNSTYSSFGSKKIEPIMYYEGMLPKFSGAVAPTPSL